MLREAWRIAKALESSGIETVPRSADVASPGKTGGPVVRVLLGADSTVEIVPVADTEFTSLWSFRKANFNYWPVVRPAGPLCINVEVAASWRNAFAQAKAEKNKIIREQTIDAIYAESVGGAAIAFGALHAEEAKARRSHLNKFSPDNKMPRDIRILRWRIRRFIRAGLEFRAVSETLYEPLFSLLYGRNDNGKVKGHGQVAFDLKERSVYTHQTRQAIETVLSNRGGLLGPSVKCALSGKLGTLHRGKFPNPSLPIVATSGIAMFSMFSEAETNFRYGRSDDEIVSLAGETVQAAHNAIAFATELDKRGMTWGAFPNGKTKDRKEMADLLIAYAHDVELPVAIGFGGDDDPNGAYEDAIEPVLAALEGQARLTPRASILLVLLRQISNAQVQSVYCRTPLASDVLRAGRRWLDAQRRRPRLLCTAVPGRTISPSQVVRLLGKLWADNPPRATKLNGPSSGAALDFMLADGSERKQYAEYLLQMLVQRAGHIIAYIASEHRRGAHIQELKPGDKAPGASGTIQGLRAEADRMCSLLALILDAKERTLEDTTRSPAYLLGLLLGLVDTLHWAYCTKVRNDVPPSLGGSQLLGIASDDPRRALGDLLERIRPWYDWADTAIPKDDDRIVLRAKKALSRLSGVAPHLAGRLPERLDDLGKAELLLGFISRDDVADQYREA